MPVSSAYSPEVASDFFEEILGALRCRSDMHAVYQRYNSLFQKVLSLQTAEVQMNFSGAFAKTDYLLKQRGAAGKFAVEVNGMRARFRHSHDYEAAELQRWCFVDFSCLCRFVSLVCGEEVPERLRRLFPKSIETSETARRQQACPDSLRLIVEEWDDEFLYGVADGYREGERLKVRYAWREGNPSDGLSDWSCLREMLSSGTQFNLVRTSEQEGVLLPELFVYEPDYLVDISAIARCFTNYAESALVHLVHKLQSAANSESIMLGHFASQLLDEQIHRTPAEPCRTYRDSVTEFWKNHAVGLLTADISDRFHHDAEEQRENIARALHETLPASVRHFDLREGMVEPSFFSEMLGLQGRMDYLQLDFRVLMEQKSGKGEFPYDGFVRPHHREEHYVQMLLYMMLVRYNFREIYERNGRELHALLLYSKYKESLEPLGFAPRLMVRAMKVRNELAWRELSYAENGGFRILESLTPEKLNLKGCSNALWQRYQQPQLAEMLGRIHEASPLEKDYFYRFLAFVSKEHLLSKMGNKTKENSGFAAKWHDTLDEKRLAGNIYDRLVLASPSREWQGRVERLILSFSETSHNDMSNFRVGDIVILYPYRPTCEPDARATMVFRCTIGDIGSDAITLNLRAAQSDARVFFHYRECLWAIEHDFMESSYNALYRGMFAFLAAPRERRDLILLQREPESDASLAINGSYGRFDPLVTSVKQARDLFLIIGPPGTGKTSFGLLNVLKEELTEPDGTVLLLSYTNRAVDEICSKLYDDGIDFIRIGGELSCSPEYRHRLLGNVSRECRNLAELKRTLKSARVFVATTTSMNAHMALLQMKSFSLCIIDEASQILEPHLIGILSAVCKSKPAIRRMVLIGDHKQLPAVVQQTQSESEVKEPSLRAVLLTDCRLSLFERLLRKYRDNPRVVYMLRHQGRMHRDIAVFPNYAFYGNRLDVVPLPHQNPRLPLSGKGENGIADLLATRRIVFLHTPGPDQVVSDKVNQVEADMIAATVLAVYEMERPAFDPASTVGVIVPYRNQIATVRNTIESYGVGELHDITIDTVERYQGSQRKYIIYGFTIQKYHQLNFLTNHVFEDWDGSVVDRKLNVAMTRAKEHLIMIGNARLLDNNLTFCKLLRFVKSRHGYFEIPSERYVKGDFAVPDYEEEEVDFGKAAYAVSDAFGDAFRQWVETPLKEASPEWPEKILGYGTSACLNAIGYGRVVVGGQRVCDGKPLTADRQVQLYCWYFMRRDYCAARRFYAACREWLLPGMRAVDGRVHFFDVGCGPATGAVAFAELYLDDLPRMVCHGIDLSPEMKKMGRRFLDTLFGERLRYHLDSELKQPGSAFWRTLSENPSMMIFNLSGLFSCVTSAFAEQLARRLITVMKKYPQHQYVWWVVQPVEETGHASLKVFLRMMEPYAKPAFEMAMTVEGVQSGKVRVLQYEARGFEALGG